MQQIRVLYLDIDGTVRWGRDEIGKFVNGPEDVRVFPEVPSLLRQYKAHGWKIVGISNQAGIGLGHMNKETCAAAMIETNAQTDNAFDKILWCPHKPDEGCDCRKPEPGLIYRAQRELLEISREQELEQDFPLDQALFVGDRPEDIDVAANAGVEFCSAEMWRNGNHLAELSWDEV